MVSKWLFLITSVVFAQTTYDNPVLKGDFPDPSIILVRDQYWATTTETGNASSGIFPLFYSSNLVHWERHDSVLSKAPGWTSRDYWAPEISQYNGRFYVYYSAVCNVKDPRCAEVKNSQNPRCIGVATASTPEGPYTDKGSPVVCQELGAIDAMAFAEGGRRYLIWKEDANSCDSCGIPSRIWLQELTLDGMSVSGPRTELLHSDIHSWEDTVVEGPFLLFRSGYYYLFYSGAACCGTTCNYALGVARSRSLRGPYAKDPSNPLIADNASWKCPGHGSIVETPGHDFFLLHHAYPLKPNSGIRDAVLDRVLWNDGGWPTINDFRGVASEAEVP